MTAGISPFLFYLTSAVLILGGIGMAVSRNLFRSAMCMLLSFVGVAGLYASMHEPFFAVVQILVYVGAITILLVFGIMLTNAHGQRTITNPFSKTAVGAGVVAVALCILVSVTIRTIPDMALQVAAVPTLKMLGIGLFGMYILPTELAAILLLVAMIGAVMIARKGDDDK